MDGSKPAICGRLKTGHFQPETGVEIYFTASSVGKVFAGALAVTPEAPGQLDSLQYRQIQLADLLEQLRGRGPGKRFRQRVPPLPVLFLQLQERLHRIVPLLWPRSAVRWTTVPDPGFAGLAPLATTCLPLRVRQRHTTMPHRYVTERAVKRSVGDRASSGSGSRVGSEPDVGVGHARPGYARETERPGWAGRCGQRRTGKGVPSSDNSSAAEGSSGARGSGGNSRCRLLRQTSLEAVLSRARTTSGWALTLGRARILRAAVQRRGNWRKAADAFGRQRNAGYRRAGGGNVPTGSGLRPAPDEPPTPHGYAPPVDSTEVVRTLVRQLRGPHLSTWA